MLPWCRPLLAPDEWMIVSQSSPENPRILLANPKTPSNPAFNQPQRGEMGGCINSHPSLCEPISSPENPHFLDCSGPLKVIPSLYLSGSAETRLNNHSPETTNFHEFSDWRCPPLPLTRISTMAVPEPH